MITTYSQMHCTDKWLNICLRTQWLWVQISLLSLNVEEVLTIVLGFCSMLSRKLTHEMSDNFEQFLKGY